MVVRLKRSFINVFIVQFIKLYSHYWEVIQVQGEENQRKLIFKILFFLICQNGSFPTFEKFESMILLKYGGNTGLK